jgi:hypothetical protein
MEKVDPTVSGGFDDGGTLLVTMSLAAYKATATCSLKAWAKHVVWAVVLIKVCEACPPPITEGVLKLHIHSALYICLIMSSCKW